MPYVNQWNGIVRLGRDPEWKALGNDNGLANCSGVISKKWKDKQSGEWQEKSSWVNLTVWGQAGQYFCGDYKKGDEILITGGELEVREYEKDGVKQKAVSIVIGFGGKAVMFKEGKNHGPQQVHTPPADDGLPY